MFLCESVKNSTKTAVQIQHNHAKAINQGGLNSKRAHDRLFWAPRNLSNHMIRQARTGDTVLVKRWQVRAKHYIVVAGGGGVKTTENKIHWPRFCELQAWHQTQLRGEVLDYLADLVNSGKIDPVGTG